MTDDERRIEMKKALRWQRGVQCRSTTLLLACLLAFRGGMEGGSGHVALESGFADRFGQRQRGGGPCWAQEAASGFPIIVARIRQQGVDQRRRDESRCDYKMLDFRTHFRSPPRSRPRER